MARRLGILFCLLGFVAVCVLPLVLNTGGPFGSLNRIEDNLEADAASIIDATIAVPEGAAGAEVVAEGRDLRVTMPEAVTREYDQQALAAQLGEIDGVRTVDFGDRVPLLLPPVNADPEPATASDPEPTAEPTAEPQPDPTAAPLPDPAVDAAEAVAELTVLDITFEPGTALLTARDISQLANAADLLGSNITGGQVEVQSHTSSEGDPDVNFLLTQDRAEAIVDYLVSEGVDPTALVGQGYGASQPLADNGTAEGRAENERVVLIVKEG